MLTLRPPTMRNILVLCPQDRDRKAVKAAGLDSRYRIQFVGEDLDRIQGFDPAAFLAESERIEADGVVATKDQSALLAAILAERRGLPGPAPEALLACQHKPTSREIQRAVAPESTPRAALVGRALPFPPPFFVKPVVGRLSEGAVRVDRLEDLPALGSQDGYADRYAAIAALAGADPARAHGFLAEELLKGLEVTLEGYVHKGRVTTVGVTDSLMYPGTISFERFEYPSALDDERQAELAELAERLVLAHGLDDAFFNLELFVPPTGPVGIIELNGRLASQFAPLVLALHGRSTYDALFELACGEDPGWSFDKPDGVGISYVLRVFADALVEAVPEPAEDLEVLVRPGLHLSEQGTNDAQSYRLAILYGTGETREEALERCRARAQGLNFQLRPAPVSSAG
jgi:biotin carboxylase